MALMLFMAVRGGMFCISLMDDASAQKVVRMLQAHPEWDNRTATVMLGDSEEFFAFNPGLLPPKTYQARDEQLVLLPGEYGVSYAYEHYITKTRIFHTPLHKHYENIRIWWGSFKAEHALHYIGQPTPGWAYGLYGGWLHGSTLSQYEFPAYYVYYYPLEQYAEKRQQYNQLYQYGLGANEDEYLQALLGLENAELLYLPYHVDLTEGQNTAASLRLYTGNGQATLTVAANGKTPLVGMGDDRLVVDYDAGDLRAVWFGERSYEPLRVPLPTGLLVVYDKDIGRVMEWWSVFEPAVAQQLAEGTAGQ